MVSTNKNRTFLFLLIPTLLMSGCNGHFPKTADADAYLAYISNPENGLVQKKEINDFVYEIRYLSPEAMALTELKTTHPPKQQLETTIQEYGQMAYFRVSITAKDGHLFNALQAIGQNPDELESYLNYDAEHDFTASTSVDTAACGLYSFSRSYGLSTGWQLMLAFDVPKWNKKSDIIVTYNDKIAENGQLNFLFSGSDIANTPKLIY